MNYFANPNNGVKLTPGVNCGCCDSALCAANFFFDFNLATNQLILQDRSFLADGDSIVPTTGINVLVQDAAVPTAASVAASGDATASIVISTAGLDPNTDSFRIDYDITTVDGCTSSVTLFFNPNVATEGSPDAYYQVR